MVKFSFFTVRSKCCKKSKFVLFLFYLFSAEFSNSIYILRLRFFLFCCPLWLLLSPSNNVSVERSPILCTFSHSLFFLFRFSASILATHCLKKASASNPQNSTNCNERRFTGEGWILFHIFPYSFFFFISEQAWGRKCRLRLHNDGPTHGLFQNHGELVEEREQRKH